MKNFIIFIICMFFLGCGTINGIISPEQQCNLLKSGGKMGIGYITTKDAKLSEASYNIVKTQIMPKLEGKTAEMTKKQDLDEILNLVNKNFGYREKVAIQSGIDMILAWTPPIKEIKEKSSTWSQLLNNIKCLFQGVLEGFASSQMSIKTKTVPAENPEFKVKWKSTLK